MAQQAGILVDFSKDAPISGPPAVLHKDPFSLPDLPTDYELDIVNNHSSSPQRLPSAPRTPSGAQTPMSEDTDIECSRPPSPDYGRPVEVVQTMSNPPMNKFRLLTACLMNFRGGLNDSAPGALIPYMEKQYDIGYAVVSLIFVANAAGFIIAAPLTFAMQSYLGRAKAYMIAEAIVVLGYIMLACNPPFPVVIAAFFFLGLGIAISLALNNVFCANLANNTAILGLFHGSYGIGGTIGPLIATSLVIHGRVWSTFYFISLAVAVVDLVIAFFSFRVYPSDTSYFSQHDPHGTSASTFGLISSRSSQRDTGPSKLALLKQALRQHTTLLGAAFIFAYQGAEVSISGWVISFLIAYRHSSAARVGYVTAGFWGGITVGRFFLSHPAHLWGEKYATVAMILGATGFQVLVWRLPDLVGEAISVALVGLLLGPIYPCATAVFTKLLPRRLQVSSLAFISAMGSSGGAVAPFLTGLLAQSISKGSSSSSSSSSQADNGGESAGEGKTGGSGTWVLHPICIALFTAMLVCWLCLPRIPHRRD